MVDLGETLRENFGFAAYCRETGCHRGRLLRYFGGRLSAGYRCGNCSGCREDSQRQPPEVRRNGEESDLHVLKGSLEIRRGQARTALSRSSIAVIEAQEPASIRMDAGCWMVYLEHPLAAWIRSHAR